jgi:isopentenyl-diphosphate Delta-isomerase
MLDDTTEIAHRKADHLDLCATDAVAFKERTTLLECVRFEHVGLPELALSEIDTRVTLLGKTLRAPIVIAGMTGGHSRAAEVNRTLASIAEARGYGFGLGSQRALDRDPSTSFTYRVRDVAPSALVLGNIGVVQARDISSARAQALVDEVGADALCVHMNPAMELVQPGGDRDFRHGLVTFERLVSELSVPVVAKETGAGIGSATAERLFDAGVRCVDTSGAGGTSWVGVETLRAEGAQRRLGEALWDWGVPTAASVLSCVRAGHATIATGGLSTGLDVARAVALGASAGGIARGAFMAFMSGGRDGAEAFFDAVEEELRAVMLLVGAKDVESLRRAPKMITGELAAYAPRG